MFLLLSLLFAFWPAPASVQVTALPRQVLVERDAAGQYLNFDFVVENLSDETLQISRIEVSVYDDKDRLGFRRAVDSGGFSPSIQTVANREVAGRAKALVFNPFHTFAPHLRLARLRFAFTFRPKGGGAESTAEVVVTPTVYETKTGLSLPVRRRVQVTSGHDFYSHHRRLDFLHPVAGQLGFGSNFMRYGYDFFVVDERGEQKTGSGERFEDYLGFGAPLYAPGPGRVAALANHFPEDLFGRNLSVENLAREHLLFYGNYVVIDHRNGEYSLLAHLKQGSVKVKVGDEVRRGQEIAQIGCSGSAETPHLHYELRTGAGFDAEGLPSYFSDFRRVLGAKMLEVKRGRIDAGDIVESR